MKKLSDVELREKYEDYKRLCLSVNAPSVEFKIFKDIIVSTENDFFDAGDVEDTKGYEAGMYQEVTVLMREVNEEILFERIRQNRKWGHQRHPNGSWLAIAIEEIGEAAQAMMKDTPAAKETDASNLYGELIQASAVLQAWAEQVKEQMDAE